jgi:hypothetical protein
MINKSKPYFNVKLIQGKELDSLKTSRKINSMVKCKLKNKISNTSQKPKNNTRIRK